MTPVSIFLVDDDPGYRHLIRRAVEESSSSIQIESASNVSEFFQAVRRRSFDCIVMDFNLSECDADELLKTLKKSRVNCPTIVISGCDEQQVVVRSLRGGVVDFLNKRDAIEPGRLWERINVALRKQEKKADERRQADRRIRQLIELSETDPLTGLLNRRGLERRLFSDRRAALDRRGFVSVVMLDIDHFKRINDTYGHAVGDRVLRAVARTIRDPTTICDISARWGGEEFLVLKSKAPETLGMVWAQDILVKVERLDFTQGDSDFRVTISAGVHGVRADAVTAESIKRADSALYDAKRRGRNRACCWLPQTITMGAAAMSGDIALLPSIRQGKGRRLIKASTPLH